MNYSYYEELAKTTNELTVDDSWGQGRSVFGGLTTAMVLTYIETQTGLKDCDLRTINIHFCGAAIEGELCELTYKILSEGRSVIQVEGQLLQNGAVKTQVVACFSRQRVSGIRLSQAPIQFEKTPQEGIKMPFIKGVAPGFVEYLDTRFTSTAMPYSGSNEAVISGWVRFEDRPEVFSDSAILALIDAWPPAVMPMLSQPAPTSSITWNVDFIQPRTELAADDYLYYHCEVVQADLGYAHTEAKIYHPNGELLALSRQLVGVYDKAKK
jgi:acyl-CoA thioesterase